MPPLGASRSADVTRGTREIAKTGDQGSGRPRRASPRHAAGQAEGKSQFRARHRASAAAAVVFALGLIAAASSAGADTQRTLSLYNIHTKERLTSVYKKNGKYVPEEMQKINWLLRDWRKDEATTMDPELVDLLWEIHSELGSKEPIHIISGYRSRGTNEMLRRTVGGQASQSRHILGKAAELGTIEPGKFADIIVVRGNPLFDIQALASVEVVVKGGVVYKGGPPAKAQPTAVR